VLREVLQLFQEMMPTRLGTLQTAVAVNDFGLVERTAHAIKGSAGNIGARGLHDACSIAEHAARGHDSETVRAGVASAVCEARRVSSAISLLLT
jgi:HPt (histidine-containing phosphotransfer) domain-containing protein